LTASKSHQRPSLIFLKVLDGRRGKKWGETELRNARGRFLHVRTPCGRARGKFRNPGDMGSSETHETFIGWNHRLDARCRAIELRCRSVVCDVQPTNSVQLGRRFEEAPARCTSRCNRAGSDYFACIRNITAPIAARTPRAIMIQVVLSILHLLVLSW